MNCPICGSAIESGAEFCPVCGASVANQQAPQQVQQPMEPQAEKPPKKKKKNVAVKVIAVVLALLILVGSGLFLVDSIMFKKEVEAQEIITDFPVLKQKTDFLVYNEETFPSEHYKITVERVITGNVLKSEAFRQTKVIIEDESTEPVYNIDFKEDGEYIITLEDIPEETTTKAEATTALENQTEKATEEALVVTVRVKVEEASKEAIDKVDLNSKKGDKPVEIPTTVTKPAEDNLIEATEEDFESLQEFLYRLCCTKFEDVEKINYDSAAATAQYVVDNLVFDPALYSYELFYGTDHSDWIDGKDPLDLFGYYRKVPEENIKWICENIYNVKYEDLAVDKLDNSQIIEEMHYLHDGYYYQGCPDIGDADTRETKIIKQKIVDNKYEFIVEISAYSAGDDILYFKCTKKFTAAIKEIDGERYWSIYSIENFDESADDQSKTPDWVSAYREFLLDYDIIESDEYRQTGFSLCYIDDNDIPELVIGAERGGINSETAKVYTYRSGEVLFLCEAGNRGQIEYKERGNKIYTKFTMSSMLICNVCEIKDNKCVDIWNGLSSYDEYGNPVYKSNNAEITEDEFNKLVAEHFSEDDLSDSSENCYALIEENVNKYVK